MENLLLLSCIESRVENHRSFYGRFQLGPFQVGQGITIANTFRRVLLSELTGLAITSVKINDASHEYSTLQGVRESVLTILLNLKQIILTSDFELNESQVGYLNVQGPAIVRASDLKLPIGIQCVDPEQYIATLSYDGILKLKLFISTGKNYISQTPLNLKQEVFSKENPLLEESKKAFSSETTISEGKSFLNKTISTKKIKNTLPSKILIYEKKINTKIPNSKYILESKIPDGTIPFSSLLPVLEQKQKVIDKDHTIKGGRELDSSQYSRRSAFALTQARGGEDSTKGIAQKKANQNSKNLLNSTFFVNSDNLVNKTSINTKKKKNRTESFFSKPKINFSLDLCSNFYSNKSLPSAMGSTAFALRNERGKSAIYNGKETSSQIKKPEFLFFKKENNTNTLPIDAVFMPVNKVNFMLESDTEAEKTTERIILEIWTNGSIHPRQAIHEAAKSIVGLFFPFQESRLLKSIGLTSNKILQKNLPEIQEKLNFSAKKENIAVEKKRYSIDIGNLDFSLRPYTCLKRANINTVGDLVQYSAEELLLLKNFGKRSLEEVEKNLAQMGLTLNMKT